MTYVDEAWYSVASASKSPMGVPQLPRSILEKHVKSMEKGTVETGVFPPDRMPIALTMLQGGHFVEYMGTDASIYPAKVLETFRGGEKGPFLYLLHGKQDSAVPAEHSERFVEAWKGKFGQDSVVGKFEDGDHGHDGEATLETPWMKEGLAGVTKSWIG